MIKCKIKDKIVFIQGEGGFSFKDFENEINKVMNQGPKYIGFI